MRETYHDKKHKILIDKQQKLLIDSLTNKLRIFQEQSDKISKQDKEELQQSREKYHDKKHKIMIGLAAKELKFSRETAGKFF